VPPAQQPSRRRVVKKVAGHGHHGGAWKIAYADFVTAMMALFMVLWLLASTDQNARKEISQYFRTGILPDASMAMSGGAQYVPAVIEQAPTPPPPGEEDITSDVSSLRKAIKHVAENHTELADIAARVRVIATDDGVLIEIADEDGNDGLLFNTSSAQLKPGLVDFLEALAPILATRPETIELHGHTDAAPFPPGSTRSNWELSYERAAAARRIIESGGVKPDRIVGVIGRGAATPLDPAHPYAAKNRRLSVLLRLKPPTAATVDGVHDGKPPELPTPGEPTPQEH
jgi:chemotaxis protein MotB